MGETLGLPVLLSRTLAGLTRPLEPGDGSTTSLAVWSDVDDRWAGSPLRTALEALVARLPLELPWFPASYGAADPSAVGGSFVAPDPANGVPAHGQDWRPVFRDDGDTVRRTRRCPTTWSRRSVSAEPRRRSDRGRRAVLTPGSTGRRSEPG